MRITPRGTEYKPVVALLESDQFDTAEQLAKAIVTTVYNELAKRDMYLTAEQLGDTPLCFGPFSSPSEADKFTKRKGTLGPWMTLPVFSAANMADRIDQLEGEWADIAAGKPVSCECGHPIFLHEHKNYAGKCAARGCRCKTTYRKKED